MVAEEIEELGLGELQRLEFLEEMVLACFNPLLAGFHSVQPLKNLLAKLRIHIVSAQLLVRIINIDGWRRMVDGHGAVRGFPRNLHPEEASGGEQFLLADRGFIS